MMYLGLFRAAQTRFVSCVRMMERAFMSNSSSLQGTQLSLTLVLGALLT